MQPERHSQSPFSYLHDFHARFQLADVLGRGSFGVVRRAIENETLREYAVKIVPKHREGAADDRVLLRIREEVDILERVQPCTEAIYLLGVFEDATHVFIVTEVCEGGDLEEFIKENGCLTEKEAARVAHDILRVLVECHRQGICYADVKPANFLLKNHYERDTVDAERLEVDPSQPLQVKVADFGCSQRVVKGAKLHKRTGTPLYMAPELFMRYYGLESDLWSMGMMLYQLLSGELPFWKGTRNVAPFAVMTEILSGDVTFEGERWEAVSPLAKSMISALLDRDYNTRLTAASALQHPWIREQCGEEGCIIASNRVQSVSLRQRISAPSLQFDIPQ